MQSKIIIGLALIIALLLVEVFSPRQKMVNADFKNQQTTVHTPDIKPQGSKLPEENETLIQVTTVTGSNKNAGTDSKVGIFINGNKKLYTRLDSPKINDYKSGATNSYSLIAKSSLPNLNSLTLMIDGHDAWFLKKVTVRLFSYSHQKQVEQQFEVNRWFSSEQKDIKEVNAVPSMKIDFKKKRIGFYSRITSSKSPSVKSSSVKSPSTKTPPPQTKQKPFSKVDAKSKFSGQGNLNLNIDEMALIENENYKVLIDFTKTSRPDRSTEYRCRFFNKKTNRRSIVVGHLIEKYEKTKKADGKTYLKDMGSVLDIKFKDTKIRWSYAGHRGGWLYLKSWDSIDVLDEKLFDKYKLN